MNTGKTNVPERQLRNHERLAAIPTIRVAQVAATLLRDGGDELDEVKAIRKAYTLLDIAEHCKRSLATEKSVEAGIKSYLEGIEEGVESAKIADALYVAFEKARSYEFKIGPDGKKLPVPFDEGLEALIPLPNSTRNKADVRMLRFKRFVAQRLWENKCLREKRNEQEEPGEQDKQDLKFTGGDMIAKMKREGIDARLFEDALLHFRAWWDEDYRLAQSAKGKRGQDARKSKRVKSRSDKRKGARSPRLKTRASADVMEQALSRFGP